MCVYLQYLCVGVFACLSSELAENHYSPETWEPMNELTSCLQFSFETITSFILVAEVGSN